MCIAAQVPHSEVALRTQDASRKASWAGNSTRRTASAHICHTGTASKTSRAHDVCIEAWTTRPTAGLSRRACVPRLCGASCTERQFSLARWRAQVTKLLRDSVAVGANGTFGQHLSGLKAAALAEKRRLDEIAQPARVGRITTPPRGRPDAAGKGGRRQPVQTQIPRTDPVLRPAKHSHGKGAIAQRPTIDSAGVGAESGTTSRHPIRQLMTQRAWKQTRTGDESPSGRGGTLGTDVPHTLAATTERSVVYWCECGVRVSALECGVASRC